MKIKNIAIVGGGTSGWLAANHLGSEFKADQEVNITLIESPDVPTIGVGEGTVPYIMKGLKKFGISEAELLYSCDTTFKQGIKFVDWLDVKTHGHNHYYHPFDVPYPGGFDVSPYWISHGVERPFGDVGIQSRICELGLAPKRKSSTEYEGELSYAYHFDASKFANLLTKNAKEKFNVKYLQATITGSRKDKAGNITHLLTNEGLELPFDFYVDCSGFSSTIIEKELDVPFINKADELFTDTVLVQQMPTTENDEINPFTTSTAHKAGWIWDIPLVSRRGTGFVYASKYMSDDEALTLYADYLNVDKTTFAPRKLDMKIGYREKFWHKNCVALGLAQGFLEPLEATSILLTDFSAELLARNFPKDSSDITVPVAYYNKVVTYAWERVVDFIKLHYCLSDRKDSQFWIDNQNIETFSDELKDLLNKFKCRSPQQSDFFSRFDMFDDKNFLYVLYGMKFKTQVTKLSTYEIEHCENLLSSNDELVNKTAKGLLKNKDWLLAFKLAFDKTYKKQ